MIKIRAKIKLYQSGRKTPFVNGYRPMFNFIREMKTSGRIQLLDRGNFFPGDEAEVEIVFLNNQYLGSNFRKGATFTFDEGYTSLGEGKVIEILDNNSL